MKKFFNAFLSDNIQTGYLYAYVHFMTEVVCFFALKRLIGDSIFLWISPVLFDILAFAPQGIVGYFNDKYEKMNCGVIGSILMSLGIIQMITSFIPLKYLGIALVGIGNTFMHVAGAETTLRCSNGKMAHSAIFVGGGSFGVITGKLLGDTALSMWFLIPCCLTMIPFCLLADSYIKKYTKNDCNNFNYANAKLNPWIIILLATFVVIIRGYTGYGIPTSWDKTVSQTIILYVFMGFGKSIGGILIDTIGMRKTALGSVTLAIPFLLLGDNLMVVSLIGVMLFSMTMAVTLGLLVSVLKTNPGLAFGYTTIGLLLGTIPALFYKTVSFGISASIIVIMSVLCLLVLNKIVRKDEK